MAKNKEMEFYIQGMQHALKVIQQGGVEELERELKYRSTNPLPMNVSRQELTAVARMRAKEELMIVATAMATTLTDHIKMPPSITKDFLRYFNNLTDIYRMDPEQLKQDQERLDKNYYMNQICKDFLEENESNGTSK